MKWNPSLGLNQILVCPSPIHCRVGGIKPMQLVPYFADITRLTFAQWRSRLPRDKKMNTEWANVRVLSFWGGGKSASLIAEGFQEKTISHGVRLTKLHGSGNSMMPVQTRGAPFKTTIFFLQTLLSFLNFNFYNGILYFSALEEIQAFNLFGNSEYPRCSIERDLGKVPCDQRRVQGRHGRLLITALAAFEEMEGEKSTNSWLCSMITLSDECDVGPLLGFSSEN